MSRNTNHNKIDVVTFGCRLNAYESEVMASHAHDQGLENTVIFNTCAVTNEATRQARQSIRRVRRERPDARIIVTGCAAQIEPERFGAMDDVDLVIGNIEKLDAKSFAPDFGLDAEEKIVVNDIMSVTETAEHLIDGFSDRVRAFVQIQNGCDHRCTFCIIPFGRGNSRSVPAGEIVRQIRHLVERGTKEIVLTGVDITSYGADLPSQPSLGALVERILTHVPNLPRLRLSSIDSIEVDDTLFHLLVEEERMMPHLHLSLQSGDNLILKRMKRRHTREDAIAFCQRLQNQRPEMVFGADIIAGFPTETEEMFDNSLRLVDECGLTFLHVFPYSAKEGTPAARIPQVPGKIIKHRAARLREKAEQTTAYVYDGLVGTEQSILMEKPNLGHTNAFAPVEIDRAAEPGAIIRARVTGHDGKKLDAQVL